MGRKFKYSHYCLVPIDRSELLNVTDALEKAIHVNEPQKIVTITINGADNTTVELSSEQLTELVGIMKMSLNDD